jgi:hypothetical protein
VSPTRAISSHGVTPIAYAAFRTGGSLRTDDPLGCCAAGAVYHIIVRRCPG